MAKKTNSNTLTSSTRIELVEGYFDNNSKYWSEAYLKPQYINDFVLINRNKIAVDFLCSELKPTLSVLDAGCGAGLTTLALVEKGFFRAGYGYFSKNAESLSAKPRGQRSVPK